MKPFPSKRLYEDVEQVIAEGRGLGAVGNEGIAEPIRVRMKDNSQGLGFEEQMRDAQHFAQIYNNACKGATPMYKLVGADLSTPLFVSASKPTVPSVNVDDAAPAPMFVTASKSMADVDKELKQKEEKRKAKAKKSKSKKSKKKKKKKKRKYMDAEFMETVAEVAGCESVRHKRCSGKLARIARAEEAAANARANQ